MSLRNDANNPSDNHLFTSSFLLDSGGGVNRPAATQTIITISGKAREVLNLFSLYCREHGHETLGELAKGAK